MWHCDVSYHDLWPGRLQDDLCQVLLFLQTNREEEAVEKLNQVPEVGGVAYTSPLNFLYCLFTDTRDLWPLVFVLLQESLVGWLNDNLRFVLNSDKTQLSKLGKVIEKMISKGL